METFFYIAYLYIMSYIAYHMIVTVILQSYTEVLSNLERKAASIIQH